MVGYRVGGASSIWMSFIKYTILTAAQELPTTFTVSNYPHQSLLCEEPTPPSEAARPNWRPFNQTQHPQSPIHDVASSNPSCVTYPTGRLSAWPASVLFRSWRMLECKFTTQDQRCPWVSASSNYRLGSSIWAAIISARYCFVYFGSRMETLLHFARRRKLFIEEGEWCCARDNTELAGVEDHRVSYFLPPLFRDVVLVTIQNLPVLKTTGYPISFPPSSLKMWFFGMQAVSGRISRQKIMRS